MLPGKPILPFAYNALEPFISAKSLQIHFEKYHVRALEKLRKSIAGTSFIDLKIIEIVRKAEGKVFTAAAQCYNHGFFWENLAHPESTKISQRMSRILEEYFGTIDNFKLAFESVAGNLFGSGWVWLLKNDDGSLVIITTTNGNSPAKLGLNAILACDIWEHSYYLDYQAAREKYLHNFWKIVNWDTVERRYFATNEI